MDVSRGDRLFPFSSHRKRMTALIHDSVGGEADGQRVYSKGAAEIILESCKFQTKANGGSLNEESSGRRYRLRCPPCRRCCPPANHLLSLKSSCSNRVKFGLESSYLFQTYWVPHCPLGRCPSMSG